MHKWHVVLDFVVTEVDVVVLSFTAIDAIAKASAGCTTGAIRGITVTLVND